MTDKITFSNTFGEKYHMPVDGPHSVTIGNAIHNEPLAEQLKMVLQREADTQRRHDEKVERLEEEIERLTQRYNELGNLSLEKIGRGAREIVRLEIENERLRGELQAIIEYSQKHVDDTDAYVMSKRNTQAAQNALGGK